MNKTIEELRNEAIEILKNGGRLIVRGCSLCYYPCGFVWKDGKLNYDSGCDCTCYPNVLTPRSVKELDTYLKFEYILKRWGINNVKT